MNSLTPPQELWSDWDAENADLQRGNSLRRLLVLTGGLVLVILVLALVVPIGSAVIASGAVTVEGQLKRIAHPTGGAIANIAVENGDHVEEGQVLIRLEDTVSGAASSFSEMTVEQMLAQQARLEAERLGAASVRFPTALQTSNSETAKAAMMDEQQLFRIRRQEEAQIRAQLRARIAQHQQQIRSLNAQISSNQQQLDLIQPELQGVRDLWEQELVTISRLNELERTSAGLHGRIAALQADIARMSAAITETQQQLIQLTQSRRADAAAQLASLNTALNDVQTRNIANEDQQENRSITAPYSGVVEKLRFSSVGEVIQPAQPILEIVPDRAPMIVEAYVDPVDIDRVLVGQSARIRFPSFNTSATPEIQAEVTYVAKDRSYDENEKVGYFLARLRIDSDQVEQERLQLTSGMPAEVYIQTGDRSMISFLTKPLQDQFARAFRYD